MTIILCYKCDEFFDNDYFPCDEVDGELWCESCAGDREADEADKAEGIRADHQEWLNDE